MTFRDISSLVTSFFRLCLEILQLVSHRQSEALPPDRSWIQNWSSFSRSSSVLSGFNIELSIIFTICHDFYLRCLWHVWFCWWSCLQKVLSHTLPKTQMWTRMNQEIIKEPQNTTEMAGTFLIYNVFNPLIHNLFTFIFFDNLKLVTFSFALWHQWNWMQAMLWSCGGTTIPTVQGCATDKHHHP